ncbi:hypothetical protein ACJX0J_034302 [Zea mays]
MIATSLNARKKKDFDVLALTVEVNGVYTHKKNINPHAKTVDLHGQSCLLAAELTPGKLNLQKAKINFEEIIWTCVLITLPGETAKETLQESGYCSWGKTYKILINVSWQKNNWQKNYTAKKNINILLTLNHN